MEVINALYFNSLINNEHIKVVQFATLYELLDPYLNNLREDEIFYTLSPPVDPYRASLCTQDFARINQIRGVFLVD